MELERLFSCNICYFVSFNLSIRRDPAKYNWISLKKEKEYNDFLSYGRDLWFLMERRAKKESEKLMKSLGDIFAIWYMICGKYYEMRRKNGNDLSIAVDNCMIRILRWFGNIQIWKYVRYVKSTATITHWFTLNQKSN